MNTIDDLIAKIIAFRDARDWAQYHNPKDLSLGLSIEAAELLEHFLWKSPSEVEELCSGSAPEAIRSELADVLIFALLLAHRLGVDPQDIVEKKLAENAVKYPVEKSRGRAVKYTEL